MIVLDTNVISYLMRRDPHVMRWLGTVPPAELRTTSITRAEIFAGLESLPDGRRRTDLLARAERSFTSPLGQGLPFDDPAADHYAHILTKRRRLGKPMSHEDCQIAAITLSRGARLATRNTKDFDDCGLEVINPFAT